jgi:glycosyltransferase
MSCRRSRAELEDPQVDGVYGDLTYVSAHDPARIIRYWRADAFSPNKLRREVFEPHGPYDTMLRYLSRGGLRLAYIPDVLVSMRAGGKSNRSLGRMVQKSREDCRAICKNRVGGIGTLMSKNFSKPGQFRTRA